ncbi:uncharacterized protein LOC141719105 [Apium graveolens]|uniref:uncharacterized protein LOC141719105 n=1 Tax=Apium graveolens TaxID=4045 RepID=UPI003D79939A
MTCFKYGKASHMAKNCKEPVQKVNILRIARPAPPQAQSAQPKARTFNMTMKDVVQDADVVAKSSLVIEVANQDRVIANRICPNCDIVIEGRNFSADLIPFKLGEFDVILGMDWLVNHDTHIECRSKKVKLRSKDRIEVIFKGKKQDMKLLTEIQTRILLCQGCEAYLAHVKDVEKEPLNIEDTPVVKEFTDIFPDEFLGLPTDREIEFTINLAPKTEPVSKTPYQMTFFEMKDLAT